MILLAWAVGAIGGLAIITVLILSLFGLTGDDDE